MDGTEYLRESARELRRYRALADKAFEQVPGDRWREEPASGSNSLAVVVKHVAGNLHSRWTDFLTTDGEKPDRDRDGEFEIRAGDDGASLRAAWSAGWETLFAALDALQEGDLSKPVRIRGEELSALQAIQRSLTHTALHVGQIVYVSKMLAGAAWTTLTIPRGGSKAFNAAPKPYRDSP
jgi:uncharacterized damage-inducible protein DinB